MLKPQELSILATFATNCLGELSKVFTEKWVSDDRGPVIDTQVFIVASFDHDSGKPNGDFMPTELQLLVKLFPDAEEALFKKVSADVAAGTFPAAVFFRNIMTLEVPDAAVGEVVAKKLAEGAPMPTEHMVPAIVITVCTPELKTIYAQRFKNGKPFGEMRIGEHKDLENNSVVRHAIEFN
jgi:hypothetical protein